MGKHHECHEWAITDTPKCCLLEQYSTGSGQITHSDKYCQDHNYYQPDIYRLPALFLFFPDLSGGCYSSISHSVDEGTLLYLHIAYLL